MEEPKRNKDIYESKEICINTALDFIEALAVFKQSIFDKYHIEIDNSNINVSSYDMDSCDVEICLSTTFSIENVNYEKEYEEWQQWKREYGDNLLKIEKYNKRQREIAEARKNYKKQHRANRLLAKCRYDIIEWKFG